MKLLKKYRAMVLYIIDIIIINSSYIISSCLIKGNQTTNLQYLNMFYNTVVISLFVYLITFNLLDVYRNITRFENGFDYIKYISMSILSGAILVLVKFLFKAPLIGYREIVLATILTAVMVVSYRVIIRFTLNELHPVKNEQVERKNILIIGAGEASSEMIKTIKNTMRCHYNIVGLIDDNPNKMNYAISGIKILGNRYDIANICRQNNIDIIFFSISNIDSKNKKEILNICQETGVKIRVLPSVSDIIKNKNLLQNLRDIEIEDLLGREPITLSNDNIEELIKGQTILVTGGGGSIGSELCRQIAKFNPSKLIIFDIYENNLYNIEMELKQNHYDEKFEIDAIVGSVRDKQKLEQVFKQYNPYLVFHAAAHKHVPLMEVSPLEAIKNNVFGTYNMANCADKYNVKRFVLISTDKAVNPTNIMGATKRMCEMIIQAFNKKSKTEFAAVRFGNVLGSNGSVLPLFKKQIANGGPVTVTHRDITRFFMTIPEAVSLVLQAMSYAKGGEIFVLDMGEPVKIYDLAVSLIKLSGLEPNVDIEIKITGLRPGEKLYEELLMSDEGYEQQFIKEAFDTNWIAPLGENVNKFEEEIANYVGVKTGAALSAGSAAIHLGLKALNVKQGDIVFCSSLTFSATCNPIIYQNATPVFIDSEYETWNMDPLALEKAFEKYPNPKAVIVVHLYGTPAKMDEIIKICKKHNVPLIEDAAESLGSIYNGQQTGTFGEYGVFSFNGNKIITTSGGGMLVSNNEDGIKKVRFWATQSKEPVRHYEHKEIGYNYRMSNICAGIGRGQLKVLDKRIEKKTEIYNKYKNELEKVKEIKMQPIPKNTKPNHWLSVMTIDKDSKVKPLNIMETLEKENIDSRPVWKPMHLQPVFKEYDFITAKNDGTSVSEDLFNRGVCLPSDTKMTEEEQERVIDIIKKCFE